MRICPECDLEVTPDGGEGAELHCPRCARPTVPPDQVRAVQVDARLGLTLREKFFLRRVIRRGGLGTVYQADNHESPREAAVKIIRTELAGRSAERRFYVACAAAQRLDDRAAARVVGFGQSEQGYLYCASDLLRGETLKERLSRSGRLTPDLVVRLAAEVAAGLQDSHEERLVHGDVKPANVFLVNRHRAILTDHGLSLAFDNGDPLPRGAIDSLLYRAPEWTREASTPDSIDRYSLGCVVYEMLTGHPPFSAEGAGVPWALALRDAHRNTPPPRIGADLAPEPLADLVEALLHKRSDRRPTDTELGTRLGELQRRGTLHLTAPAPAREPAPARPDAAPGRPEAVAARAPSAPPRRRSYEPAEPTAPAPVAQRLDERAAPALTFPGRDPTPPPPEPEPPEPEPGVPPPEPAPEPEPDTPPQPPAPEPEPDLPPVEPDPQPADVPPDPEPPDPGPGPVPDPAPLAIAKPAMSKGAMAAAAAALYALGILTGLLF